MAFADRRKLILESLGLATDPKPIAKPKPIPKPKGDLGSNFYNKLIEISNRLSMKPDDILLVMTSESGLDPAAKNPSGEASGLIQFMPNTLKGMNFKGTPEDLRNMTGEQQLDLVERFIKNGMSANGGPFISAAQLYICIFYPAALKLPGIRKGDPGAIFIEKNPESIPNPKSTESNPLPPLSKKHYSVGYSIKAVSESGAFLANKVFSRSIPDAITYGDMMKQVEINKRNSVYQKASAEIQRIKQEGPGVQMPQTPQVPPPATKEDVSIEIDPDKHDYFNVGPAKKPVKLSPISAPTDTDEEQQKWIIDDDSQELMSLVSSTNYLIIKISSKHFEDACEYANILSLALEEELNIKSSINTDNKVIEIECKINNDPLLSLAICDTAGHVETLFKKASQKIGDIYIDMELFMNKRSCLEHISIEAAEKNYKKFLLKFI